MSTTENTTRIVNVTDRAAAKALGLLAGEPEAETMGLRIAVRPGGCSGFSYEMHFDHNKSDDNVDIVGEGLQVFVDPTSAQMLLGASLDYVESLEPNKAGFQIDNPNASKSCGCGSSFS